MNEVKQIVVNGGTSGIGFQAVKEFVDAGHRVLVLGRRPSKAKEALLLSGHNLKFCGQMGLPLSRLG